MAHPQRVKGIAKKFKDTYYRNDDTVRALTSDNGHEYVQVEDPLHLASFVAFCSGSSQRVFLRGEVRDYPTSGPSLFRNAEGHLLPEDEREKHWYAYQDALLKLRKKLVRSKESRWRRPNIGAILQHYGIRTPWLDVVRNLHTAIWFATNELSMSTSSNPERIAKRSNEEHGWVSVYALTTSRSPDQLKVNELLQDHSSRHFRPHAQQGLSIAMQQDSKAFPSGKQDFRDYRVGHVCFPNPWKQGNSTKWKLSGHMFTASFLFPDSKNDNSLKELEDAHASQLLRDVCQCHKLDRTDTLGTVYRVRSVEEDP